jgi:5'-phosphate synthase pdxT subunit
MIIGVLALQGDFIEHIVSLEKLGARAIPVRKPDELKELDGLIIPGGESTTIMKLLHSYGFLKQLKKMISNGLPVMGTCAGMILMAKNVSDSSVETLSLIDMEVKRNAFGRQVDSFEVKLDIPALGAEPFPAVFIRAPLVEKTGSQVEVLGKLNGNSAVAVRQGKLMALAFHPELGNDYRLHRYFLESVVGNK